MEDRRLRFAVYDLQTKWEGLKHGDYTLAKLGVVSPLFRSYTEAYNWSFWNGCLAEKERGYGICDLYVDKENNVKNVYRHGIWQYY